MTQPSWPGGISKTMPGPISLVVPSSSRLASRPEMQTPTWWYWHRLVPAMGWTCSIQCQPGSNTILPITRSSRL